MCSFQKTLYNKIIYLISQSKGNDHFTLLSSLFVIPAAFLLYENLHHVLSHFFSSAYANEKVLPDFVWRLEMFKTFLADLRLHFIRLRFFVNYANSSVFQNLRHPFGHFSAAQRQNFKLAPVLGQSGHFPENYLYWSNSS